MGEFPGWIKYPLGYPQALVTSRLTIEYPPEKLGGYRSSASFSFSIYSFTIFCWMTVLPQSLSSNHGWRTSSCLLLVYNNELEVPAMSISTL